MKNILFITHSSSMFGGAEDEFERLLKYFSGKSSEYYVEGLFPKGERSENYASYCNRWGFYRSGTFPEIYLGLWKIIKYLIISIIQFRDIYYHTKGKKYDVAILNVSVLIAPIVFLKMKRIKSIVFIRESINQEFLRLIIYKLINSSKNYYIGVSTKNEKDFKRVTGNKNTLVLYSSVENGKNESTMKYNELKEVFGNDLISILTLKDTFPVFVVAPICTRKNQILLIKAMKILKDKYNDNNTYAVLIGQKTNDEKYSKEVEDLIDSLNLRKYCFLPGALNKDLLNALYNYAKAMIIVSKSEGLPLVMVEAFKNKMPLITTNVGGISEFVKEGETGYFINDDAESLAKKIDYLKNNADEAERVANEGYKLYLNAFNLENNMKKLERLINSI